MIRIREAESQELECIRAVHLRAFAEGEKQIVSALAVALLSDESSPATITLVADDNGAVVGHVAFSPVTIKSDPTWKGSILAPLGVIPEYQKQRIGSRLVESGIERLSARRVDVLFVYGDPGFYGKFGFSADAAARYSPPFELQFPFGWQALVLSDAVAETAGRITCVTALQDPQLW